jgi:hypothetical protein
VIEALFVTVLTLGALAFVTVPLRRGRLEMADATDALAEANAEKRSRLTALLELEEERYSGRLSDSDLEHLQPQYESEAVEAMKKVDALAQSPVDADSEIEAEIAHVKSTLRCPSCGAPRRSTERCPECGA